MNKTSKFKTAGQGLNPNAKAQAFDTKAAEQGLNPKTPAFNIAAQLALSLGKEGYTATQIQDALKQGSDLQL
ncbi:MAG: hypothetical protein LBJ73_02030 [Rickettsiales bacterium]|jgi:hypothetical protein|nr:hypothetical protein [Rickettsiales bacterium]